MSYDLIVAVILCGVMYLAFHTNTFRGGDTP